MHLEGRCHCAPVYKGYEIIIMSREGGQEALHPKLLICKDLKDTPSLVSWTSNVHPWYYPNIFSGDILFIVCYNIVHKVKVLHDDLLLLQQ